MSIARETVASPSAVEIWRTFTSALSHVAGGRARTRTSARIVERSDQRRSRTAFGLAAVAASELGGDPGGGPRGTRRSALSDVRRRLKAGSGCGKSLPCGEARPTGVVAHAAGLSSPTSQPADCGREAGAVAADSGRAGVVAAGAAQPAAASAAASAAAASAGGGVAQESAGAGVGARGGSCGAGASRGGGRHPCSAALLSGGGPFFIGQQRGTVGARRSGGAGGLRPISACARGDTGARW